MKKISIIYWSGTGNTETMAKAIAQGINVNEVEVKLLNVSKSKIEDIIEADAVALGSPAMGTEVIEEDEMEPFIENTKEAFVGKNIILFGSYGWGDGEWLETWQENMEYYGANIIADNLMVNNEPEDEDLEKCKEYGMMLQKLVAK